MSMTVERFKGQHLLDLGWESGPALGSALRVANRLLAAGLEREVVIAQLNAVRNSATSTGSGNTETHTDHPDWGEVAQELVKLATPEPRLRDEPAPLNVWGRELIDAKSFEQINNAARLPVTLRVALMPDAHVGYGLPIGGVAALEGAIAPYMVGVDIGCQMHATIFKRNPIHLRQKPKMYEKLLLQHTYFGRKSPPRDERNTHAILDDPRWEQLPRHLQNLQTLAAEQLGTSGGGNHFVEWTEIVVHGENPYGLEAGKYIALVSHSGSRGVGFKIANHYTKIAEDVSYFLPKALRKLGYLDYARGEGQEYEVAMNLAGDFARANHEVLHERISNALGGEVVATLQNHHNFAWRVDREKQSPVFVHRKGATPAEWGVVGIIPGSMATPGFFVEGRCDSAENILNHPSLNSAAHGSGRKLGRKQAQRNLDARNVRQFLKKRNVTLLGGGLDEAPNAYKNSRDVIKAQSELVRVWAEFQPVIVRMASDGGRTLGQQTGDKAWERRKERNKERGKDRRKKRRGR